MIRLIQGSRALYAYYYANPNPYMRELGCSDCTWFVPGTLDVDPPTWRSLEHGVAPWQLYYPANQKDIGP